MSAYLVLIFEHVVQEDRSKKRNIYDADAE
jgi:hypothetical protein